MIPDCVFWSGGNVVADVALYKRGGEKTDLATATRRMNALVTEEDRQKLAKGDVAGARNKGFPGFQWNPVGSLENARANLRAEDGSKANLDMFQQSQNFACLCTGDVEVFFGLPFGYAGTGLAEEDVASNRGKVFLRIELPTLQHNRMMTSLVAKGIYGFTALHGPNDERLAARTDNLPKYNEIAANLANNVGTIMPKTTTDHNKLEEKHFIDMGYRKYLIGYKGNCGKLESCKRSYQPDIDPKDGGQGGLTHYATQEPTIRLFDWQLADWGDRDYAVLNSGNLMEDLLTPSNLYNAAAGGKARRVSVTGVSGRQIVADVGETKIVADTGETKKKRTSLMGAFFNRA